MLIFSPYISEQIREYGIIYPFEIKTQERKMETKQYDLLNNICISLSELTLSSDLVC